MAELMEWGSRVEFFSSPAEFNEIFKVKNLIVIYYIDIFVAVENRAREGRVKGVNIFRLRQQTDKIWKKSSLNWKNALTLFEGWHLQCTAVHLGFKMSLLWFFWCVDPAWRFEPKLTILNCNSCRLIVYLVWLNLGNTTNCRRMEYEHFKGDKINWIKFIVNYIFEAKQ